jgi:capsular polysaccharide biosynthesis protein
MVAMVVTFLTVFSIKTAKAHFFVIKPNRYTNFTNLFCHEKLHISDNSSVHHQEFRMVLLESCAQTCMTYTIAESTVNELLMMDR